jgi:hypothetical protein
LRLVRAALAPATAAQAASEGEAFTQPLEQVGPALMLDLIFIGESLWRAAGFAKSPE